MLLSVVVYIGVCGRGGWGGWLVAHYNADEDCGVQYAVRSAGAQVVGRRRGR